MATNQAIFQDVLAKFTARLTKEEIKQFKFSSVDDVKDEVLKIQDAQGRRGEMMNLPRIQSFLEAMQDYGKVIEVFLNASSVLCFIWGPMKFCLQVASAWAESFDTLLDAYKQIAEHLPLMKQIEALFEKNPQTANALSLIYKDILDFHLSALRFFTKSTWKQLFSSAWKDFRTKFQHILEDLQSHGELLYNQTSILQIQQYQTDRATKHEIDRRRRFLSVMTWLSCTDAYSAQKAAADMREDYPTTGKWILKHDKLKPWMDPSNITTPIVWMSGKPGAGKTILTSCIIEERQRLDPSSVIFFYCKYDEDEQKTFLGLARSFLAQLLSHHDDLLPYLYDQYINSGCQGPTLNSSEKSKEILKVCLNSVPQTYIIVDGIDECSDGERKTILTFLVQIIKGSTGGRLRGLFVSQEENNIQKIVRGGFHLRLTETDNKSDITIYTSFWLKKLREKFGIPVAVENYIREAVENGCDGMFLFAKLVLTNLYNQVDKASFYDELKPGTFPKGFEQAYERIVKRIYNNPVIPERKATRKVLGLIVSAKRHLKWNEIQGAIVINTEEDRVDFDGNQILANIKDLCGSLIDILPENRIQLVHATAKTYLTTNRYIEALVEECNLSILALKYLMLPCFDPDLPDLDLKQFVLEGAYAFQDYATLHWVDHLEAISHLLGAIKDDSFPDIDQTVESFFDTYGAGGVTEDDIPQKMWDQLRGPGNMPFARHMLFLLVHARKSRQSDGQLSSFGDLGTLVQRTRKILEAFHGSSEITPENKQNLQIYYGNRWHKCPHHRCFYFHEGFPDANRLKSHISRHEKPFCCTETSCPRIHYGFSNERELKKHIAITHPDPAWKFPKPKQAIVRHKCDSCSKDFSRASSLRIHVLTHTDERNHKCSICDKSFVRKHDCDRHMRIHQGKKRKVEEVSPANSPASVGTSSTI